MLRQVAWWYRPVFGSPSGRQTFTYTLGNGQNFLTMNVVPGTNEFITAVTVTMADPATEGWESFKQPRVSGVCQLVTPTSCTPVPTPEPATLALVGVGLLGLGVVTRRRMATRNKEGNA